MRIISLTPSITETLIDAGANVIGRSRFCIYPKNSVDDIPKVGGTKDIEWDKLHPLNPDLIVLDKEENTREMAETCPFPYIALHITDVHHVAPELSRLADAIDCPTLLDIASRWETAANTKYLLDHLKFLPGMIEWWIKPTNQNKFEYLIWKKPWMAIGPDTFIHSMLRHLGAGDYLIPHHDKYPTVEIEILNPADTVLLFSSEPFPFANFRDELLKLGFCCGLIEAEFISWYGIRSLTFLESQMKIK